MEVLSYTDDSFDIGDLAGIGDDDLNELYQNTLSTTRYNRQKVEDEPRYLTDEEIEEMVNAIPTAVSPDKDVSNMVMESIRSFITRLIKELDFMIIPSAIPDLKEEIIHKYRQTKIAPGSAVGFFAAQAISAQLMQATLNTFHKSGSKKNVASGFRAYYQLLKLSPKLDFPSCDIFFNDNSSYEDIIRQKRASIVYTSVKDVIKDYDIMSYADLISTKDTKRESWYSTFYWRYFRKYNWNDQDVMYDKLKESSYFLRLIIDVNKTYEHKITISDVSDVITERGNNQVVCINSPYMYDENNKLIAYIDIYPLIDKVKKELERRAKKQAVFKTDDPYTELSQIYINTVIVKDLNSIKIKGIENIKELYPEEYSIWDVVISEKQTKTKANRYLLTLDTVKMTNMNITKDNIYKLWKEVLRRLKSSIKISEITKIDSDEFMFVDIPDKPTNTELKNTMDNVSSFEWNPSDIVNYIVQKDIGVQVEYQKEQNEIKNTLISEGKIDQAKYIPIVLPRSDFQNVLYYVYAVSDGSNLETIFELPDVDTDRTISNVPREIVRAFGIEAARNFICEELYDIIVRNDNYVNPRNIMVIASHMTYLGFLLPISETGMKYQPIGTHSRAGFRKAAVQFKPAFQTGRTEDISSVNTSIMLGRKIRLGTGLPSANVNKGRHQLLLEKLKEQGITSNEFEDQFAQSNRIEEDENNDMDMTENVYVADDSEGNTMYSGDLGSVAEPMRHTSEQVGGIMAGTRQVYGVSESGLGPDAPMANSKYITSFRKFVYLVPPMSTSYIDAILGLK